MASSARGPDLFIRALEQRFVSGWSRFVCGFASCAREVVAACEIRVPGTAGVSPAVLTRHEVDSIHILPRGGQDARGPRERVVLMQVDHPRKRTALRGVSPAVLARHEVDSIHILPDGGQDAHGPREGFVLMHRLRPKKNGLRDVSRRPSCQVDENYTLLRRSRSLLRYRRRRLTGTTAAPEGALHRLHVGDE